MAAGLYVPVLSNDSQIRSVRRSGAMDSWKMSRDAGSRNVYSSFLRPASEILLDLQGIRSRRVGLHGSRSVLKIA